MRGRRLTIRSGPPRAEDAFDPQALGDREHLPRGMRRGTVADPFGRHPLGVARRVVIAVFHRLGAGGRAPADPCLPEPTSAPAPAPLGDVCGQEVTSADLYRCDMSALGSMEAPVTLVVTDVATRWAKPSWQPGECRCSQPTVAGETAPLGDDPLTERSRGLAPPS